MGISKAIKSILILVLCFDFCSSAQHFNKVYIPVDTGNYFFSWGRSIIKLANDTTLLAAHWERMNPDGKLSANYSKLDANGDTVSVKLLSYADSFDVYMMHSSLLQLNDSIFCSLITVVQVMSVGGSYTYIPTVHILWLNKYMDTLFSKQYLTPDNINGYCMYKHSKGVLVCGIKSQSASVGNQIWLLNIDFSGNTIWEKMMGESGKEAQGFSACAAANGGFYVTALSDIVGSGADAYTSIYRIDSNGNKLWKRKMYKNSYSVYDRIREDFSGNYFLGSFTDSVAESDDNTTSNGIIAKIDSAGNRIWEHMFNDVPYVCKGIWDFQVLWNSDILLYGTVVGGGYNEDYGWLCRMDSSGNVKWEHLYKSFGGSSFGYLCDGVQMSDGGFLLTGCARDSLPNKQGIWLLRVDSMGCLVPGCVAPDGSVQYEFSDIRQHKLYPNPNHGSFTIEYPKALDHDVDISIFDMTGKIVYKTQEEKGAYRTMLTLNEPGGIYLVQLTDENGRRIYATKLRIE